MPKTTRNGRVSDLVGQFAYMNDNAHIRRGYRLHHNVWQSAATLFTFHNETVNVWSHMIGGLLFLWLLASSFVTISTHRESRPWHSAVDPLHAPMLVHSGAHTRALMIATTMPTMCIAGDDAQDGSPLHRSLEALSDFVETRVHLGTRWVRLHSDISAVMVRSQHLSFFVN